MPLGANKAALFGVAGVATGTSILLATGVASASASLIFTLPTIYKQVVFSFHEIQAATDATKFGFQCSIDGGSNYNTPITSTAFSSYNNETGTDSLLTYNAGMDLAQGTTLQTFTPSMGTDADQCLSGELNLFNPASTTYVKNFCAHTTNYDSRDYAWNAFQGGYVNDGANDLTNIKFYCLAGNITSGTIKMWGVL